MVWNMVYEPNVPQESSHLSHTTNSGSVSTIFSANFFPSRAFGVRLAAHPDDPPMPTMRGQPRLVYQPQLYSTAPRLTSQSSQPTRILLSSLAEMAGVILRNGGRLQQAGQIGLCPFPKCQSKVPHYKETFVDDGDIDMLRILQILKKNQFDGVIIPDHTPQMTCDAPWHAGMAYAMGYMKAALQIVNS